MHILCADILIPPPPPHLLWIHPLGCFFRVGGGGGDLMPVTCLGEEGDATGVKPQVSLFANLGIQESSGNIY